MMKKAGHIGHQEYFIIAAVIPYFKIRMIEETKDLCKKEKAAMQ